MVKFLRKYNKYILVVGGSLLMIAFLVPQAFNTLLGDPMKKAYAYIGDEKISHRGYDRYQREYHALDVLYQPLLKNILRCESTEHWILLSREAEAGGFVAESGDGAGWSELNSAIEQEITFEMARRQESPQVLRTMRPEDLTKKYGDLAHAALEGHKKQIAGGQGLTLTELDGVIATARGVFRMITAFDQAPRFSDRRALALESERLEGATVDSLRVPAERIAFAMPEPTEEELKAHFEKYRDVSPDTGDLGIGYRLPPRVKLEWLTISRKAVEDAVPTDAVEANKRWRNNRAKYPGEFPAEQARIEAEVKKEQVDRIMSDIGLLVRGELNRATGRLESDGPYKKLPADWSAQRPRLEDLQQKVVRSVKENAGVDVPLPEVTVKGSAWLTSTDLFGLPGIGQSQVSLGGGQSLPFSSAVFGARELRRPDAERAESGLQVGVTSGDLVGVDRAGSRYFFTILDFRPESAPDSLDEVRARCVESVRRLKAFDWLKDQTGTFEAIAAGGLEEVKKLIDDQFPIPKPAPDAPKPETAPADLVIQRREMVARFPGRGDNPADSPEFRARVLAIAEKLDPTKPAEQLPADQRAVAVAAPKSLSVQVALVIEHKTTTYEVVRGIGEQGLVMVQRQQAGELEQADPGLAPFQLAEMKARWKFRFDPSVERGEAPTTFHIPSPKRN